MPDASETEAPSGAPLPSPEPALPGWVRPVEVAVAVALAAVVLWSTWPSLAPSSVWIDDAWVALAVKARSPGQLVHTMITAHGFMVVLWGWLRLAGTDGLAVQFLPLVFGTAAPGALWLGLRRWARWPVGPSLAAAALVATSPLVVVFSGRVKQYTLDVLLAALLTAAALALARDCDNRRRWLLTWGALVAVVLSTATATVGGSAVLLAFVAAALGEAGGRVRDVRFSHVRATGGPFLAFLGLAGLWGLLVVRATVPRGMYSFWEGDFLPVDQGVGTFLAAVGDGFSDLVPVLSGLPVGLVVPLAAIGVGWALAHRPEATAMALLPMLATIALSALGRAPWGGGRTESHLVVAFAIAVAASLLPRREGGRSFGAHQVAGTVLAGALAIGAVATVERPTYPQEDLRPLLADLEAGIRDDEVILVYPFARLTYALYTPAPVTFKENPGSSVGYALDIDDPRVRLLAAWRRDPTQYLPMVTDLTEGACGAWLPSSHSTPDDLGAIEAALVDLGFTQVEPERTREGAALSHWRRPTC